MRDSFDVNLIRLRENISFGQRVGGFVVETSTGGDWQVFGIEGTSVGSCRIMRSPSPVSATSVRLRITQNSACPALSEFGIFSETL
jgi:alpha-L-fucosidase